jgi:hypothetical protein
MIVLIIYVFLVAYLFIFPHLAPIQKDLKLILLTALLLIIPSYIAIMISQYKFDCKRRDLTHVIFVIFVGLVISLLITVEEEWVAFPSEVSSTSFKNMSVSVERISPFTIPLNSFIHSSNYSNIPVTVTIYNYTSIEPVSVSMSTSANTIFDYEGFQNKSNGYDPRTKRFVYSTGISARHTGEVFNSTNEYVINIGYRNMSVPQNNTITAKSSSTISSATANPISNLTIVNITDITASEPLARFNTIDNNLNTSWSADGDGQLITYIFDSSYNISKVGIAFFKGNVRENYFEINGQQFNSSGKTTELENFTLKAPLINTKSLQIIGHGNSGGGDSKPTYNAFTEVKVYRNTSVIPPKIVNPLPKLIPDNRIYHNPVPFQWTVRMTDLSLTTYFWIIMIGVVTSRFMSLILDKTEGHPKDGKNDKRFQIIEWRDGLGILFSFIIALILFSSFKQQLSSLTTMVLFNISIAFAFGFGFDKTLEVVPRFSSRYRADLPTADANRNNIREGGSGTKTGDEGGSGTKTGDEGGSGTKTGEGRTGTAKS